MGLLEARAGLAGKVALVAGGGGGLGRASALDLARAGVNLALADKDEELLRETEQQARAAGVDVLASVLDVRVPEALEQFFIETDEHFGGRLDVLVNVVGGSWRQPFADSKPNGWATIMRTNFTWLLHSIHLAIPRMRASGGGSIINFTSSEGHRAAPGYAVYAAMKAGVVSLGKSLALELAPDNIRINDIAPDFVPTEGLAKFAEAQAEKPNPATAAMRNRFVIPLGRPGTYEDIGSSVLFLASDLSQYITGSTVHCDGGVIASHGWKNWPGEGWIAGPPPPIAELMLRAMGETTQE